MGGVGWHTNHITSYTNFFLSAESRCGEVGSNHIIWGNCWMGWVVSLHRWLMGFMAAGPTNDIQGICAHWARKDLITSWPSCCNYGRDSRRAMLIGWVGQQWRPSVRDYSRNLIKYGNLGWGMVWSFCWEIRGTVIEWVLWSFFSSGGCWGYLFLCRSGMWICWELASRLGPFVLWFMFVWTKHIGYVEYFYGYTYVNRAGGWEMGLPRCCWCLLLPEDCHLLNCFWWDTYGSHTDLHLDQLLEAMNCILSRIYGYWSVQQRQRCNWRVNGAGWLGNRVEQPAGWPGCAVGWLGRPAVWVG
ncbi:hypothetical protein R6Q59_033656 [Mikania micrantha]